MITLKYIDKKIKQLSVIENSTLLRKCTSRLANDWGEIESGDRWKAWARKRLIVNHQYKFIYCTIPKNASSSLMKSIISLNKSKKSTKIALASRDRIRDYVESNYALNSYRYSTVEKIVNSDYLKFVVVRNPWARLVSTYINLFIRFHEHGNPTDLVKSCVRFTYGKEMIDKYSIGISFEDFVRYVVQEEDCYLDQHCVPQYLFLGGLKYDFTVRMERLNKDLSPIEQMLGISFDLPKANSTQYSSSSIQLDNIAQLQPHELRKYSRVIPNFRRFYTQELIDLVAQRYRQDCDLFEYTFNDN